ncbi:hypothetical protein AVEN_270696-1 [Araneus ventricosus]|uniref:Histone-lysine N-methyltransferase SETMAR n=1 Tax=Araneus ventricosus TaxID=182803 RepID=A0A4Y2FD91_ARAVE|nr:hypothetical protein AVEN_270696-1 [Araneus ventricosus]
MRVFHAKGRTDVYEEHGTGRPSVISDALLRRREETIQANRRLTLRELHKIIPRVSMKTFHECVTVTSGYHKLCARWVPKMLTEEQKEKRMGFSLDFLTPYADTGDEFLNNIVTARSLHLASSTYSFIWRDILQGKTSTTMMRSKMKLKCSFDNRR